MERQTILDAFPLAQQMMRDGIVLIGNGPERAAKCFLHPDKRPSMSVNVVKQTWYCQVCDVGGSVIDYFAQKMGMTIEDTLKKLSEELPSAAADRSSAEPFRGGTPIATYVYRSAIGEEVFRVLRYEPKTFRQQKKTGNRWEWGMDGIERVLYRLPEILQETGKPVWICYAPDTEVLTPTGWKFFPDLQASDEIAQYDSGAISFVRPLELQRFQHDGQLICFDTTFCQLQVTPEHRMLVRKSIGPFVTTAENVRAGMGIPVSGLRIDGTDPGLIADQIRLMAAFAADGSIPPRSLKLRWGFRKPRKIERLKAILSNLKVPFQETLTKRGDTDIQIARLDVPWLMRWMPQKQWTMEMLDWPLAMRQLLLDELKYWDGSQNAYGSIKFDTVRKSEADAISAIAVTSGYCCSVNTVLRSRPRQTIYSISLLKRDWKRIGYNPRLKTQRTITRKPYIGPVYCCTVPSGYILVRRNGKSCVSGNCEGEKDSNNLVRYRQNATCNVGGAGKWMDGYTAALSGKDVIICGDNDDAGVLHVKMVIEALDGKVKRLRVVTIPKPYKDVSDFLTQFGALDAGEAALNELVDKSAVMMQGSTVPIFSMSDMEARYREYTANIDQLGYSFANWLPSLGRRVRRMVPGDIITFVAATGSGKTAILQNMFWRAAPMPSLLFEMELADTLTFERFVAGACRVPCDAVEEAYRNKQPVPWRETGLLNNIYVCPLSGLTVAKIEETVNRAELKMGVRPVLVGIDYAQLLSGKGKGRYEKVTDAMSELKSMAKNTGTIVAVASQIQRKGEEDDDEVGLYAGKDSGQIENSSGLQIGFWKDRQDPTLLHGRVNKNTKGQAGFRIRCNFDGARMIITERAEPTINN